MTNKYIQAIKDKTNKVFNTDGKRTLATGLVLLAAATGGMLDTVHVARDFKNDPELPKYASKYNGNKETAFEFRYEDKYGNLGGGLRCFADEGSVLLGGSFGILFTIAGLGRRGKELYYEHVKHETCPEEPDFI